jgi:hypothetical protein
MIRRLLSLFLRSGALAIQQHYKDQSLTLFVLSKAFKIEIESLMSTSRKMMKNSLMNKFHHNEEQEKRSIKA